MSIFGLKHIPFSM